MTHKDWPIGETLAAALLLLVAIIVAIKRHWQ